jgi:alkylation response protein AidB-like acyl-CoA dehydrogenase
MRRKLFDADHQMFRESARAFVERSIAPRYEELREARSIDRQIWLEAARHDFLGLSVPVEYGGAGVDDFRFNVVLTEELARLGLGLASSFGIHTDVVAPYLLELTTDAQKERWLPSFCSGELITAIGMTEPAVGSDLAGLRTSARANSGGWLLNGSKTFITNGMSADLVVVAARTGERRSDISLFGVEATLEGFSRGRKLDKIGQHEADTAELFFDNVHLGADDLIGELNGGFGAMLERLSQERLHVAVTNVEHAAAQLERTLQYAGEREAFGRSIGSFQNTRFALATATTEVEVAREFVDRCVAEHVTGGLSPIDAAKAKWWSSEMQGRVIDACVQIYGGYGYMTEYDVARAWADARVTRIWGGTNEIMKEVIGRDLGFGDPRPVG